MSLQEFNKEVIQRVNSFMQQKIDTLDNDAPILKEAISYGLLLGGKRSRPLLTYATAKALNIPFENCDNIASAIECIHAFSLIHDDMPEMDNDVLRRGQSTVHVKYNPAIALLAGDTLQALAFEFLTDLKGKIEDENLIKLVKTLSLATGYSGMCGGQAIDLQSQGVNIDLDRLKILHLKKTGALIKAAVMMCVYTQNNLDEKVVHAFEEYATFVGLAYQIWDDVLDVIGNTKTLGKTKGKDVSLHKSTYPQLLGLEGAKIMAQNSAKKAINALESIDLDTSILQQFVLFCVSRDH